MNKRDNEKLLRYKHLSNWLKKFGFSYVVPSDIKLFPVTAQDDMLRETKKILSKYHKFTFRLPPTFRPLKPNQKTTIMRRFQELQWNVLSTESGRQSFIKNQTGITKRLKKVVSKTNEGIFITMPNARMETIGDKPTIVSRRGGIKEFFIPLPKSVYENPTLIPTFLTEIHKKYFPCTVSLSMKGNYNTQTFNPMDMHKYFYNAFMHFGGAKGTKNAINGVRVIAITPKQWKTMFSNRKHGNEDYRMYKAGGSHTEPMPDKSPDYEIMAFMDSTRPSRTEYAWSKEEADEVVDRLQIEGYDVNIRQLRKRRGKQYVKREGKR